MQDMENKEKMKPMENTQRVLTANDKQIHVKLTHDVRMFSVTNPHITERENNTRNLTRISIL